MSKEIRHTFQINRKPEGIVNALVDEKHIQKWWTKMPPFETARCFRFATVIICYGKIIPSNA
jgi:hypothetical protein